MSIHSKRAASVADLESNGSRATTGETAELTFTTSGAFLMVRKVACSKRVKRIAPNIPFETPVVSDFNLSLV